MPPTPPVSATANPLMNFSVPLFYFNGFQIGLSGTEISANLIQDNVPAARMIMPLPVAKSFAKALDQAVSQYESVTSTKVPTMEELIELFVKKSNE
jgi:hypothetical protein